MSKFKIVNLIDKIFVSIAVFLLAYAWINFYLRDLILTFFISLIVSFCTVFLLYYFIGKKESKKNATKKESENFSKTILAFRVLSKEDKKKILIQIIEKNAWKIIDSENLIFLKDGKNCQFIIATHLKINNESLINLIDEFRTDKVDKMFVICDDYAQNIKTNILKNLEIVLIDSKKFYYEFLLKNDINVDTGNLDFSVTKFKFKDFLYAMFLPNKARSYFLCGLVLIFSSIILPYHTYYLIFGSIFLMFAIICKLIPKFSTR